MNIIIIGMGQMGRRHLQSVSSVFGTQFYCYDTNKAALDLVLPFLKENNIHIKPHLLTGGIDVILREITAQDLVILATTAPGRAAITERVVAQKPRAIIVEKPVCTKRKEYERMLSLQKKYGVPICVNLSRRVYPCYQRIVRAAKNAKKITCTMVINGGLACNGIHMFDLAGWIMNGDGIRIEASYIEKQYETKRSGFYDFHGDLVLRSKHNHICFVRSQEEAAVFSISITADGTQFHVYEAANKMIVANQSGAVDVEGIATPLTSEITGPIAQGILRGDTVGLPSLQEAFAGHDILFKYMEKHGKTAVPIT